LHGGLSRLQRPCEKWKNAHLDFLLFLFPLELEICQKISLFPPQRLRLRRLPYPSPAIALPSPNVIRIRCTPFYTKRDVLVRLASLGLTLHSSRRVANEKRCEKKACIARGAIRNQFGSGERTGCGRRRRRRGGAGGGGGQTGHRPTRSSPRSI